MPFSGPLKYLFSKTYLNLIKQNNINPKSNENLNVDCAQLTENWKKTSKNDKITIKAECFLRLE